MLRGSREKELVWNSYDLNWQMGGSLGRLWER